MGLKNTLKRYTLIGTTLFSTGMSAMAQEQNATHTEKTKQETVVQKDSQNSQKPEFVGYYPNGQKKYEQKNIDSSRKEYYDNGQLKVEYPACPDGVVPKNVSYDIFGKDGKKIQNRTLLRSEHHERKTTEVNDLATEVEKLNKLPKEEVESALSKLMDTYKPKTTIEDKDTSNQWKVSLYDKDQKVAGSYILEDTDFLCRDASEGSMGWKTGYLRGYSLPDENGKMHDYKITGGNQVLNQHLSIDQLKHIDSVLAKSGRRVEVNKVSPDVLSKITSQSR